MSLLIRLYCHNLSAIIYISHVEYIKIMVKRNKKWTTLFVRMGIKDELDWFKEHYEKLYGLKLSYSDTLALVFKHAKERIRKKRKS